MPTQNSAGSLYLLFLFSASIADISASLSVQPNTSMFSSSLPGFVVLGIAEVPRCSAHRSSTCPGETPCAVAAALTHASLIAPSVGFVQPISTYPALPSGEKAVTCTCLDRA